MNNYLNIYTDGGARGNPGPAAVGIVIKDRFKKTLHQSGQTIGKTTNNVAEYQAVISALEYLIVNNLKPTKINFFLDSALVVNQLNGLWKIKNANLGQLVIKIRQLEGVLNSQPKYTAIPREKNHQADRLVNQALDKIT